MRADLLVRLGRHHEAEGAYEAALAVVANDAERAHLVSRLRRLRATERPAR